MENKIGKLVNYRGIKRAQLVGVLEGDGTPESPFKIVEYIIGQRGNGQFFTYGKVAPLTAQDIASIGSDETKS